MAACPPAFSSEYAKRRPAWCGGADGTFRRPHASAGGELCMLTPVHPPHFPQLATRIHRTYRLAHGRPPTTVAVFDDAASSRRFCALHAAACASPHFVRLDLATLLGEHAWRAARSMLSAGGYASRMARREERWRGDSLAAACAPKFSGQCYQSLKKFYGAAEGPAHCRYFWVSDAETFPFRAYNFSALGALSFAPRAAAPPRLFRHLISWHPDRYGCNHTQNLYSDASCGEWVATVLRMKVYPEGRVDLGAKMRQTVFDLNNWWMYDREMVRAMIDRTEQVRGEHFVDFFASLQTTDVAFWDYVFEHLATHPSSPMEHRSFLHDVRAAFPEAFRRCCACSARGSAALPCYALSDLWSPCFRRHATDAQIGRFIVESLGMFGIFGNLLRQPGFPASILEAEPRLSWAVNNADRWKPPPSIAQTMRQATDALSQLERLDASSL